MTLRTPTLCLDTNASIDFGVVLNLHDRYDSLGEQFDGIKEYWESMHYDEHVKSDVCSMLDARHKQLLAAERFLRIVDGHAHMRLPEFARLEHVRLRSDPQALPPYAVSVDPQEALGTALGVFGKTELGLQDAMVLASAVVMGADALVSNDEDFGRAFNAGAGSLVRELAGKPLALLDHRSSPQPHATLHSMIARSLRQRYQRYPWFSRPIHVDRRRDGGWYLLYRHPLFVDATEPVLVPSQHALSVVDRHSSNVCEVREMYFYKDSLPNGVTSDLIAQLSNDYAEQIRRTRHLVKPTENRPGHIDVAIPLADIPAPWRAWASADEGGRTDKKIAPEIAVAFVERPRLDGH